MTLTALEKLVNERETRKIAITTIENSALNHATKPLTAVTVKNQLKFASTIKDELFDIHRRILNSSPTETASHDQELVVLIGQLDNVGSKLEEIQLTLAPAASSSSSSVPHPTTHHLKLPEMQLPTFEGKFEDWPCFEDLFVATIDSNASLSGAQKLQYLKTCTRGEAAALIKSFTVTDLNYTEAWKLLRTRYCNKREIIHSLIKKLYTHQRLSAESATNLQSLLNNTLECIQSLKVLGRPVTQWDDLLVFIVIDKMDSDTRSEWAKSVTGTDPPTFTELHDFMERHIRSLFAKGTLTTQVTSNSKSQNNTSTRNSKPTTRSHHSSTSSSCTLCKGDHHLYQCPKLLELKPNQRFQAIKKTSACINCLREGHSARECSSKNVCKKCSHKHHTLLHYPRQQSEMSSHHSTSSATPESNPATSADTQQSVNSYIASSTVSNQVLLKTAIVNIVDSFGNLKPCRALLDDGSEASFITEACVQALGLPRSRADVTITGISAAQTAHSKSKVSTLLHSRQHDASVEVEAFTLPKVTGTIPRVPSDSSKWTHLTDLQLADPDFSQPGEVDILLGADVVASIMREGRRVGPRNTPIAQNSIFGWVLSGKVSSTSHIIRSNVATCKVDEIMQRFWETEEPPHRKPVTKEEAKCEKHFQSTRLRLADGRFMVRLPFNENIHRIGNTRQQAERRLFSLESRFKRHPQHHHSYIEFIREYQALRHMELVTTPILTSNPIVYLPHHFVLKDDSTTSSLRVVFDGSASSSSGISLNNALLVGPTIQDDLFNLLVRFRFHVVAIKADVAKMYRQFQVHPEDAECQRILWRESSDLPIQEYRLTTVTYGTASAPFLATRCLTQLAEDEKQTYPAASEVLKRDTYVDDLMSGAASSSEGIQLVRDLNCLVEKGCLQFRKWCSNDKAVMESIPPEIRETITSLSFDTDDVVKALGIKWQPAADVFSFSVKTTPRKTISKRQLLSDLAKIFDPLGWLSPVTINAKIILQDLWVQKLKWDEAIPDDLRERWTTYQEELQLLSTLTIPRCIIHPTAVDYQIHGFCDSSMKAFACTTYLRVKLSDGSTKVNLITSRTKVAPLRQVTIPRLELCAAHLLADVVDTLSNTVNINHTLFCWTDSMIVLKWLTSPSRRWKTFVGNRVAAIQEKTPVESWHHVRSEDNPADAPSRGISPSELLQSSLWWHGPNWLLNDVFPITSTTVDMEPVSKEERSKPILMHHATVVKDLQIMIERYSDLRRLVSATVFWMKFINFITQKQTPPRHSTPLERTTSLHRLIRSVQASHFSDEYKQLSQRKEFPLSSPLRKLCPFSDSENIIRIGGRIEKSTTSDEAKHPIILPKNHHLTALIIRHCHLTQLHSGFTLTYSTLLQNYWIIGARTMIRGSIRSCVICRKARSETMQQLMGSLPTNRVSPHRPFLHCGVDFAGPFQIKYKKGRGQRPEKCYFSIFVCFSTKAVHLEAVTDLTSEAFIACYRRLTSRRGISSHLYSDNGTNFIGADREFRTQLAQAENQIQQQLSHLGTKWTFNIPSASHQGGVWESGVKSVKFHLKRIMRNTLLTLEQFQTLLCNIEACLNSRPLCAISSDPTDFNVLTPGHFLIGSPLNVVPEPDVTALKEGRLNHWQHVQFITQHFWRRWQNEYLGTLQQRHKWTQRKPNASVGDLVCIKDDNLPPSRWKLGRIIKINVGADGLVRSALVKCVADNNSDPAEY